MCHPLSLIFLLGVLDLLKTSGTQNGDVHRWFPNKGQRPDLLSCTVNNRAEFNDQLDCFSSFCQLGTRPKDHKFGCDFILQHQELGIILGLLSWALLFIGSEISERTLCPRLWGHKDKQLIAFCPKNLQSNGGDEIHSYKVIEQQKTR